MPVIEFWPDYGPGPLWSDGRAIDPSDLPVGANLAERVAAWNRTYREDKVPVEGPGDAEWLREGKSLLAELRDELGSQFDIIVTEPWWGEEPS